MLRPIALLLLFVASVCCFSVAEGKEYTLGPGDVVRVAVYGYPDLSTSYRVADNGSINFTLLGEVSLKGLTEREAEVKLENLLEKGEIVRSPYVSVIVEQFLSHQVSVLGMVSKPGKYPLHRSSTIVDMIAQAGGLVEGADHSAIVTRNEQGKFKRHVVSVDAILRDGDVEQNIVVFDGDTIYIPGKKTFYVYGEVRVPGAYPLEKGMTVVQALSVAGGLSERGTERGLVIERRLKDRGVQSLNVKLNDFVQPDDVVFVKESLF